MNDQYFTATPGSAHEYRTFDVEYHGKILHFTTDAGVFSKEHIDPGSQLLCSAFPETLTGSVLDMGCGWGAMTIMLLADHPNLTVTMAEINERALELAKRNLDLNNMEGTAVLSDGFSKIEGQFDLIMTNPPIRAGKKVIYGMFEDAKDHLRPGGSLWLVIRKQQGAESAGKFLKTLYETVDIRKKKTGYIVYECRKGE